jgi:hypothetical protein
MGDFDAAIGHAARAVNLEPTNLTTACCSSMHWRAEPFG